MAAVETPVNSAEESCEHQTTIEDLSCDLLENILFRVTNDTGNKGLKCLEVCRLWKEIGALAITSITLGPWISKCGALTSLSHLWRFGNLQSVCLRRCKVRFRSWREELMGLKEHCPNLTSLQIHEVSPQPLHDDLALLFSPTFSSLHSIAVTDVSLDDTDQSTLPPSSSHPSRSLTTLRLDDCNVSVPQILHLTSLRSLTLTHLAIHELPSLEPLSHLEALFLPLNDNLAAVNLAGLSRLRHLDVHRCPSLELLTHLEQVPPLLSFSADHCDCLSPASLFPPLARMTTLESLSLSLHSDSLSTDWLLALPALKDFKVFICSQQGMRKRVLPSASVTHVVYPPRCGYPVYPEFAHPQRIKHLKLSAVSTAFVSSLNTRGMTALESLHVRNAKAIKPLPDLPNLRELTLSTSRMPSLPVLGSSLTSLSIAHFGNLNTLLPLAQAASLQSLIIDYCDSLKILPPLSGLTALTTLTVRGCEALEAVPELPRPSSLFSLTVTKCRLVRKVPSLADQRQLAVLDFQGCFGLREIPPICHLASLEVLNLSNCRALSELPPLQGLVKLKILSYERCTGLIGPPPLGGLLSLHEVRCRDCSISEPCLEGLPYEFCIRQEWRKDEDFISAYYRVE